MLKIVSHHTSIENLFWKLLSLIMRILWTCSILQFKDSNNNSSDAFKTIYALQTPITLQPFLLGHTLVKHFLFKMSWFIISFSLYISFQGMLYIMVSAMLHNRATNLLLCSTVQTMGYDQSLPAPAYSDYPVTSGRLAFVFGSTTIHPSWWKVHSKM